MEREIEKAIRETLVIENKGSLKYAVNRILRLFSVINSRLSELEEENRKLKFMTENGLGAKDLENDCL